MPTRPLAGRRAKETGDPAAGHAEGESVQQGAPIADAGATVTIVTQD